MDENLFKKEKDSLAKQVEYMLKEGRKIYDEKLKMDARRSNNKYFGGIQYWQDKRTVEKDQ